MIPLFVQRKAQLNVTTASGHTPLALACMNGHAGTAQALCAAGAALDIPTNENLTAQDLASLHTGELGSLPCGTLLTLTDR